MKDKQTAVEWFSNRAYELFEKYSEGKFDRITLNKLMLEATDKAKEMEKSQHEKTYNQSLMSNYKTFDDYYEQTYGGNK
jgi:hypothetical protein